MREKKNYFFKSRNFSDTKPIKYKPDTKSIKYKPTVIVILRGHIRNSFDNTNLYDYVNLVRCRAATQKIFMSKRLYLP